MHNFEAATPVVFLDELMKCGDLDRDGKRRFLAANENSGQPFDVIVTELGLVPEIALASRLAHFFQVPQLGDQDFQIDADLIERLDLDFLKKSCLLPVILKDDTLLILLADPFDQSALSSVEFLLDESIRFSIAPRKHILELLETCDVDTSSSPSEQTEEAHSSVSEEDLDRLHDIASEAPVVRFVTQTLQDAVDRHATDIHLEPMTGKITVRYRIDGILHAITDVPKSHYTGIVTRLKVLSRLNIAERRRPQDGRMRVSVRGRNVDLRISILPTINGETIVLRILDKSKIPLNLDSLGFDEEASSMLEKLAETPNGIILATGPTGSGKTTTLYALLRMLMRPEVKIFTIENPVEYKLDNAVQLQVNPDINFTFAAALRSVLRQDPDVILVGEIRDKETAEIAIRASLTGHLVFASLHTNSAVEAITRLRDMGVDSFLLAATVRGIIAQRLVRKLCPECFNSASKDTTCGACNGSGYAGRSVCYEIMKVSKSLSAGISSGSSTITLQEQAIEEGLVPLQDHAASLVESGKTSPEEVRRVIELSMA